MQVYLIVYLVIGFVFLLVSVFVVVFVYGVIRGLMEPPDLSMHEAKPDDEIIENVSLETVQGRWRMVSVGRNGNFAPQHVIEKGNLVMTITADRYLLNGTQEGGRLKICGGSMPTQMDQLGDDGDSHLCIVRIRNKELEICQAEVGGKRPSDFRAMRSDGASLTRFEKIGS